jgi:hypothetical protein
MAFGNMIHLKKMQNTTARRAVLWMKGYFPHVHEKVYYCSTILPSHKNEGNCENGDKKWMRGNFPSDDR